MTGSCDGQLYEAVTRFEGPEPGYVATSSMALESCLSVLEAQGNGVQLEGVLTPALALIGTRFQERIQNNGHGISLSTISSGPYYQLPGQATW